ncbi:MAG TPA: DUF1338 domain-containing protein, partial [Anaerolineae bacterium]|nr:DUF1338 domain-containing protein [Anaerolineae bacterium]
MLDLSQKQKVSTLDTVLAGLMRRYQARVPDVAAITTTMIEAGIIDRPEDIEND